MLSGDNSILSKAGEARDITGERAIAERVQIAYLGALAEGKGEATEEGLTTALNSEFGSGNYTLAQDLSKVTIDGKDYSFDGTVTPGGGENPGGGETQTVSDLRTASISNGVTALSDTGTTTIKDNKDNEIKVPKGFGIATDSGINVADGIVIEDATHEGTTKGSQFVWVPVGTITKTDGSTEAITLGRYVFDTSTGEVDTSLSKTEPSDQLKTSASASDYYTEGLTDATTSNTHAKDIEGFISSVSTNGGYYIARYEAGVKGTTASSTATTYTISGSTFTKNSTTANSIVTTSGVGVWNCITQPNAATVCQSMYTDVNSDLINSYAWDTAILFIQKCGSNSNYANKTDGNGTLKTTGNNSDEQCKINDMAGNIREWTTETFSYTSVPCVYRGGGYFATIGYTAGRYLYYTTDADIYIGFRPLLYL